MDKPKVTLGWDFNPTIQIDGDSVLPRKAEMIINAKYYPTGRVGEWPCDPETGEKLEIADDDFFNNNKNNCMEKKNRFSVPIAIMMVAGLILGMMGLIKMDADTIAASNFWMVVMIIGFASFAGGFIWLNVIQPRNK